MPPRSLCEQHAVRCYASALGMYERSRWNHIVDHIHLTLAKQLMKLGYGHSTT